MGNRAVITTKEAWGYGGIGIYLHWNGGRDSVEAFLEYCKLRGFRTGSYGLARLTQVIANFFGGSLCVGVDTLWHLDCDNGDNGVYIIDGWEIVERRYFDGTEQSEYDRKDMLMAIDERQPEKERLGEDFLTAPVVKTEDIKPGELVWVQEIDGGYEKCAVAGRGTKRLVNGTDVNGKLYVNRYSSDRPAENINNYLLEDSYRVDRF